MAGGDTGVSNHLDYTAQHDTLPVRVARADTLLAGGERMPNVIKIDVEGFEGEVLQGMDPLLSRRGAAARYSSRSISRSSPSAAKRWSRVQIVERLRNHGFSIKWVDANHLAARRA